MQEIEAMMGRLYAKNDQVEMAYEALFDAIEISGDFREGFYAIKLVTSLMGQANKVQATAGTDVHDYIGQALQNLDNCLATILEQIKKFDS